MTESLLKSALMKELRATYPKGVAIRHEDRVTAGIPDISFTAFGKTSWYEVKLAVPHVRSRGIQDLTMLRLDGAGLAYYIIYQDRPPLKRTLVLRPRDAHQFQTGWDVTAVPTGSGFDHRAVVRFIGALHEPTA